MHFCRYESKDTAGTFAILAWVLWNNRNNCVWNNEKEEGQPLGVASMEQMPYCEQHAWRHYAVRTAAATTVDALDKATDQLV
jgi:hypothetical protein